jgi:hypothetical protein
VTESWHVVSDHPTLKLMSFALNKPHLGSLCCFYIRFLNFGLNIY